MAIPVAYRNQLLAQFIESFVTFVYKKRQVAELLAKGDLTANEANILSHYQRDITRDRAVFAIWKAGLQDHTLFGFTPGTYTLDQVKTYIIANRAAIRTLLLNRYDAEITDIDALKDREQTAAVTEDQIANLPTLLAELDTRKAKRQMWRALVAELQDASDNIGEIEDAIEAEPDSNRRRAMLKAVSLPARASVIASLSVAMKNLVGLERQAFSLDNDTPITKTTFTLHT